MMGSSQQELEALKVKYVSLQKEWESQQEHLGRLQGDMYALRNQLRSQSAFCAGLGSTLGNLLWKVSRLEDVVGVLVSSNKLPELLSTANGTLTSFLETYGGNGLPEVYSDECQFVLSLLGVVANVAAVPDGRRLIMTEQEGRDLLHQVVASLGEVPLDTGDPLLRLLLMVCYNTSINEVGLAFLQDKKPLLLATTEILACERSPDLALIAVRILDSLTFRYPNVAIYNLHKAVLPMNRLSLLAGGNEPEMREYAQNVLSNMERAAEIFSLEVAMPQQEFISRSEPNFAKKVF